MQYNQAFNNIIHSIRHSMHGENLQDKKAKLSSISYIRKKPIKLITHDEGQGPKVQQKIAPENHEQEPFSPRNNQEEPPSDVETIKLGRNDSGLSI